jgi:molecular chaperone DnaK
MTSGRIIGIDLGTTNSCVAVTDGKDVIVIPNTEGSRTTPSVVGFGNKGERLVGQVAKRQAVVNPQATVYAVKRLMGRKIDSPEAKRQAQMCSYSIVGADNDDAWVEVQGRKISPPEISSYILAEMRAVAESYLGEKVERAVVTVPAYFNDAQRQATKDAGLIAGLKVERIINEPTAAALAYGRKEGQSGQQKIVIYDLGGGTFDVSILEIVDGVYSVKATAGDTFLGGEDFDQVLIDELATRFRHENGIELKEDRVALQRLKEAAERAKHELSSSLETEINLPFIAANSSGPKHLICTLRRDDLESLVDSLVRRTFSPCRQALQDAGLRVDQIDAVLLVGGMTRMPLVQAQVAEFFGKPALRGLNPDEVVAVGAAVQGSVLSGEDDDLLLLDVTPLSLGVETGGGVFTSIIERNTTVPTRKKMVFTTSLDNQNFVPIHVLQGERPMAQDNTTLAKFELSGIPPAPRGIPQIEVMFDIDADGIVSVTARDLGTGRQHAVRVTAGSGLTQHDIERIVAEAEAQKDLDETRKSLAQVKLEASSLLYTTERAVESYGDYVSDEDKAIILTDIQLLKEALEGEDILTIRTLKEALEASGFRIAEAMYAGLDGGPDGGDAG